MKENCIFLLVSTLKRTKFWWKYVTRDVKSKERRQNLCLQVQHESRVVQTEIL